jgi:hypothetical protein
VRDAVDLLGQAAHAPTLQRSRAPRLDRFLDRLATEAPLIITCSCLAALWLGYLAIQFAADTWLNLLGGKVIFASGLPHHDTLAVVSRGRDWIDQQWLANVFFYGLHQLGGPTLVARANVLVFVGALVLCFLFARRRGASPVSLMLLCIPAALVSLDFIRAQILAEPLLVLLVALLSAESRLPTRKVLLAFPILIIWANVHGSVVLGAALVSLLGVTELMNARRSTGKRVVRPVLLTLLPWPCLYASPYGIDLTAYYKATLGNNEFGKYLSEWAPPTFTSFWGLPFFLLVGFTLYLVARQRRLLTGFEIGALALTALSGLMAVRSIPWFTFTAVLLLPTLLDAEFRATKAEARSSSSRPLALGGVVLSLAVVIFAFARPGTGLGKDWPPDAAASVADVLNADGHARVFASYDLADWLLFTTPETRGRIAFDGRWEVLESQTFVSLMKFFGQRTPAWERAADGYRLLVLNPTIQQGLINTYLHRQNVKVLYRSHRVIVLDRGPGAGRSPRSG